MSSVDLVPPIDEVKRRLSVSMIETAMLRRLLKAAELKGLLPRDTDKSRDADAPESREASA